MPRPARPRSGSIRGLPPQDGRGARTAGAGPPRRPACTPGARRAGRRAPAFAESFPRLINVGALEEFRAYFGFTDTTASRHAACDAFRWLGEEAQSIRQVRPASGKKEPE